MKNRTLYIFLLLSSFSVLLIGQSEGRMYEIINYKDGSSFKGFILSEDESHINFELYNLADSLLLDKNLITEIFNSDNSYLYPCGRYHRKSGFHNSLSYYYGGSFSTTFQVQYLRYKIYPKYTIGGGVAFNGSKVDDDSLDKTLDFGEVFLYSKYYVNNNRRRLFLDAKLGAAVALGINDDRSYSSGALFQPGFGLEFASTLKSRWALHVHGLLLQTSYGNDSSILLSRTTFGVSWIF